MLSQEEKDLIIKMANAISGGNFSIESHSVIIQNVTDRIRESGSEDFLEYLSILDSSKKEMDHFISSVTIHTTFWYREPAIFIKVLQVLEDKMKISRQPMTYKILSMACSSGEEVYSFAYLMEYLRERNPFFDYKIEGWDIDQKSLDFAKQGIYSKRKIGTSDYISRFVFKVSEDKSNDDFFIPDKIKKKCTFRKVNLQDSVLMPKEQEPFDLILCRNVLIYFQLDQIRKIINSAFERLSPGGLFCCGVSEVSGVQHKELKSLGSAIYLKDQKNSSDQTIEQKSKKNAWILICDENIKYGETLTRTIHQTGYKASYAKNYDEIIAFFKNNPVQVVVCGDRITPQIESKKIEENLRSLGFRGFFVINSHQMDSKSVEKKENLGIYKHPISIHNLSSILHNFIGKPESRFFPRPKMILIGASTGGPEVLVKMLENLSPQIPPLLIVQHIPSHFCKEFAQRMSEVTRLPLGKIVEGETLIPGHLYMSLGDYHIGVKKDQGVIRLTLHHSEKVHSQRPSADVLFFSAAKIQEASFSAIMTGMGRDGASGLLALRNVGSETCAQNEASATVFGMPKEAIKMNAAIHTGTPRDIRILLDQAIKRHT